MAGERARRRVAELWWSRVPPDGQVFTRLLELLDPAERQRAGRFRTLDAGWRFIAARAMLRQLLGQRLGAAPVGVPLSTQPGGKPELAAGPATLHFNISHSGHVAAVGLAAAPVGVDVEVDRPMPRAQRIADRFFAPSERRWLAARPVAERARAFLGLWTCKEAYVKAVGGRLGPSLSRIEVDPEVPAILRPPDARRWSLLRAELPVGALCAVAVPGEGWSLEVTEFEWEL